MTHKVETFNSDVRFPALLDIPLLAPWPPMGVLSMGLEHCHSGILNFDQYFVIEQIIFTGF